MNYEDPTTSILAKELEHIPPELRADLLDSLHCTLHNKGYGIAGNTEEGDVEWFADVLCCSMHRHNLPMSRTTEEEQAFYKNLAKVTLSRLPQLMQRIAGRYVLYSQAARTLELKIRSEEKR